MELPWAEESENSSGCGGAQGEGQAPWRGSDHGFRRRLQESLGTMCNGVLQGGQGRQLSKPTCGGTRPVTWPRPETERVKQLTDTSARLRKDTAQENGTHGAGRQETAGAQGSRQELGDTVQRVREGRERPTGSNLPGLRFQIFRMVLAETKLRLRAMDLLRERKNSQRISVRSPTGTPHNRGAGNMLTEEGGKVWAVVRKFGLVSGLRAVGASLLRVRGADRDVKGSVGVAQGRGEDIRGPQVSARDEPRDLHLSRTITR